MPAWSPEIANEFIRLARAQGRAFKQGQLQKLTYIAHGICLASTGEPLTGDQPDAGHFGPEYARLAASLVSYGCDPVLDDISVAAIYPGLGEATLARLQEVELSHDETKIIRSVFESFGSLDPSQLWTLTRLHPTAPWKTVYDGDSRAFRTINHRLIQAQFIELLAANGRLPVQDLEQSRGQCRVKLTAKALADID